MAAESFYPIALDEFDVSRWSDLVNWALARADTLEVAAPRVVWLTGTPPMRDVMQWQPEPALQPALRAVYSSTLRWAAEQAAPTRFFRMALTPEVAAFVRDAPGLGDWQILNNLPEDPTFLRGEEVLLWTVSHEGFVWARLSAEEAATLRAQGWSLGDPRPSTAFGPLTQLPGGDG